MVDKSLARACIKARLLLRLPSPFRSPATSVQTTSSSAFAHLIPAHLALITLLRASPTSFERTSPSPPPPTTRNQPCTHLSLLHQAARAPSRPPQHIPTSRRLRSEQHLSPAPSIPRHAQHPRAPPSAATAVGAVRTPLRARSSKSAVCLYHNFPRRSTM